MWFVYLCGIIVYVWLQFDLCIFNTLQNRKTSEVWNLCVGLSFNIQWSVNHLLFNIRSKTLHNVSFFISLKHYLGLTSLQAENFKFRRFFLYRGKNRIKTIVFEIILSLDHCFSTAAIIFSIEHIYCNCSSFY